MSYYYLVASLPMLQFGAPPPLSRDALQEACSDQLRPADAAALEALFHGGGPGEAHPLVRAWRAAETQVDNAVVRHRAARLKRDPQPYLRTPGRFDGWLHRAVHEALARHSPLEREQELDRARWRQLEELEGTDPFAAAAVLVYALKLRILERWDALNAEDGQATVETLVRRDRTERKEAA